MHRLLTLIIPRITGLLTTASCACVLYTSTSCRLLSTMYARWQCSLVAFRPATPTAYWSRHRYSDEFKNVKDQASPNSIPCKHRLGFVKYRYGESRSGCVALIIGPCFEPSQSTWFIHAAQSVGPCEQREFGVNKTVDKTPAGFSQTPPAPSVRN